MTATNCCSPTCWVPKRMWSCGLMEDDVDLCLLASALDTLSPREREIITLRFGLGGGKEQTQKEVADRLGISQSYISRLEKRIIQRLKKEILRLS